MYFVDRDSIDPGDPEAIGNLAQSQQKMQQVLDRAGRTGNYDPDDLAMYAVQFGLNYKDNNFNIVNGKIRN